VADLALLLQRLHDLVAPGFGKFLVPDGRVGMEQIKVEVIHTAPLQLALEEGQNFFLRFKAGRGQLVGQKVSFPGVTAGEDLLQHDFAVAAVVGSGGVKIIEAGFQEIDERALTSTELTMRLSEDHYFGYDIKQGTPLFPCSSLDKLFLVWSDGRYRFVPPPDKLLADATYEPEKEWLAALRTRSPIRYFTAGIYNRDDVFTCIYYEPIYGFTYIKRFRWGGMIMNKDYTLVPEGSTILLLCKGTPEAIYVKFKYLKGQRITQQVFDPSEARITAASSKGIQMTPKQIERIDINKPNWWVASEGNTKGTLFQ
jgi:hypothetical protein